MSNTAPQPQVDNLVDVNIQRESYRTSVVSNQNKKCWSKISPNVRGLALTAILFTAISTTQLVFGILIGSIALLSDVSAMFIDVVCYLAALYGETISPERQLYKRRFALVVSFLSILVLFTVGVYFLYDSLSSMVTAVNSGPINQQEIESDPGNSATVMLTFGLIGLAIDLICLVYGYVMPKLQQRRRQQQQQFLAKQASETIEADSSQHNLGDDTNSSDDTQNMNVLVAYFHVAADFVRSLSTIVAGAYILFNNATGSDAAFADDLAGSIASATIVVGSLVGMYAWSVDCRQHRQEESCKAKNHNENIIPVDHITNSGNQSDAGTDDIESYCASTCSD
jgi:Co/Zn/Cd efflux system component